MNLIKKFCVWEKRQLQKPETVLAASVAIGLIVGIATDNIGLWLVLGIAIGAALYTTKKKQSRTDGN